MPETTYRGRRAFEISNDDLLLTVLFEGGHIARLEHRASGINPLWTPPWPSIEPSQYDPARLLEYGAAPEAKLLAGIMGHNLCMDIFGGPSAEEAAAGTPVHGEASVALYEISGGDAHLVMTAGLDGAGLRFTRRITLEADVAVLAETVENLRVLDHPVAWTQHVTLGPPFLEPGETEFRATATRSKVIDSDFAGGKGFQKAGAEFDWPMCPRHDSSASIDLRVFPRDSVSAGYTAHLMDPAREHAWFTARQPFSGLVFGYAWWRTDFPWLGRWEENRCRTHAPWNGKTITCGMEFGVSPMPETRRAMIERPPLFGTPGYRWIPARSAVSVVYCAFARKAHSIPENIEWDGGSLIEFLA
jgi:hypothetical protein